MSSTLIVSRIVIDFDVFIERQKMRQRYKGVDLTVTESSAAEAWLAARESSNDATVASLGATFTVQSTSNPIDQQL